VLGAVGVVCHAMLAPGIVNLGVKGIRETMW
jgi:hypothetical protein